MNASQISGEGMMLEDMEDDYPGHCEERDDMDEER